MTAFAERRADRADYLAARLPGHVLVRDEESGGLLRALLDAVAGELGVVERDLETLYDSWFVETCPDWVVPYLADLVGLAGLPDDLGAVSGAGVSRRTIVANTVAYRQRKGTVAVLEQIVRDVTGWPARAVEFHRLLGTTAHARYPRLDRPAWGSVRHAADAETESLPLAGGWLSSHAHTAEVRSIEPGPWGGHGRHGIPHIGVVVTPLRVWEGTGLPAHPVGGTWFAHPLGWEGPLFARPATEEGIEHLAGEADLAVPVRPRRLLAALQAARSSAPGEPVPLAVRVDGVDLDAERIRVCGLEDLAEDGAGGPLPGWQVMVDAVRGVLHTAQDGVGDTPGEVIVDWGSGSVADVGAGPYDRTLEHDAALTADPFVGDTDTGGDTVTGQQPVLAGSTTVGTSPTLADAVTAVTGAWSDPAGRGGTHVISIGDSARYVDLVALTVPAESRAVLVAAHWPGRQTVLGDILPPVPGVYATQGVRPTITGGLSVGGSAGSSVLLDGLVVDGDVVVRAGDLGSLTVSQCTIAGQVRVEGTAAGPNRSCVVTIRRSVVGAVVLVDTVPELRLSDSVVHPALSGGGDAVVAPVAHLDIAGSTVLGDVGGRTLTVTSSLCDGVVSIVDRQVGCARYSYLAPGSRTPRRYRCVPPQDTTAAPAPSYVSLGPGSPWFASLAPGAAEVLRTGGEFGAEMGVHHHLRRPVRLDAARRLVAPYLPAGMQIDVFGS
ncbi:phage tail protein [uncultured Serinicoccus sp.]|uniref:phage tail protein n=1 Tax=uncultured Serinicoccus sp. TaxID=735514 RepID=UPI00260B30F5|nr:phage tail protein [uncultured Serinicoccus sp.]